jgi:hypothetical protein
MAKAQIEQPMGLAYRPDVLNAEKEGEFSRGSRP